MDTKIGLIKNQDMVLEQLEKQADCKLDSLADYIHSLDLTRILYYDSELKDETVAPLALVKLLPLAIYHKVLNRELYLKFNRNSTDRDWVGAHVGTFEAIERHVKDSIGIKAATVAQSNVVASSFGLAVVTGDDAVDKIYTSLINRKIFDIGDSAPKTRLRNHLVNVAGIIRSSQDLFTTHTLSNNRGGRDFMFNTGLLDCYGSFIYVICANKSDKLCTADFELVEHGFQLNKYDDSKGMPDPVNVYRKLGDIIFDRSIRDLRFNESSKYRLQHIVKDRRDRLGDAFESISDFGIVNQIQSSINYSIMMSKVDINFIAKHYSIENCEVQYLFPIFSNMDCAGRPAAALVVKLSAGDYVPVTVLDLTTVYYNALAIGDVSTKWLL